MQKSAGSSKKTTSSLKPRAASPWRSGENLTLEGKSSLSGKPIKIRLTDYGLEFYGDITEITRVKEARCVYIG